jgi:hypothetical protein
VGPKAVTSFQRPRLSPNFSLRPDPSFCKME